MSFVQRFFAYIQHNPKRIFVWGLVFAVIIGLIVLYKQSGFSLEEFITQLWDRYVET